MKYLHPDNRDKPFVDWRNPNLRKEAFFRWVDWRYVYHDIDHYHWNNHYMSGPQPDGKPMTREQKFWFSFLFGMTYQSSMAWVFYWHFPDPSNIDFEKLDKWNRETMPLQQFATDTRYNKGHIVKIAKSFLDWVAANGGTCEKAIDSFIDDNQHKSFIRLFNEILSLYKFGRMTSWLFTQCLYESAGLQIRPTTMFASDPSSSSVWNGLMFLNDREDMTVGKQPKFSGYKPTEADRKWVDSLENELDTWLREEMTDLTDYSLFSCESALCQYKKIFVGGDYPGHSAGDATSRMLYLKNNFPEVDFSGFYTAAMKQPENIRLKRGSKQLNKLFMKTGQFINLNNHYDDLPDMWKELDLDPGILSIEYDHSMAENQIRSAIENYQSKNDSSITQFMG